MILLYGLSVAWFVLALVLTLLLVRQGDNHAAERELWRSERQLLQARALKPYPSPRRPEPEADEEKMAELRRLAERPPALDEPAEPRRVIVPVDF